MRMLATVAIAAAVALTLWATPEASARQDKFYDPVTRTWQAIKPGRGFFNPAYRKKKVVYRGAEKPGTIVIDTNDRFLYYVLEDKRAIRYGIGVGREGFEWSGTERITRKAEWPSWHPPAEMRVRERKQGRILPVYMPGGPENPLGARALYLGSTLYRIHGTNAEWTIGHAVSSGCIRMRNDDVIDLYNRTKVGTTVKVL